MNHSSIKNKTPFLHLQAALGMSCLLSCFLLFFRFFYSGSLMYGFLVWNLFLAFVPYALSLLMYSQNSKQAPSKFWAIGLFLIWFLFYPNALYIVTDFIHLRPRDLTPMWFDLLLIFSFTWNGMVMGFVSLYLIQGMIERAASKIYGWFGVAVVLLVSSFGIYLGRFLRWNSWDVFLQPQRVFYDIINRVFFPLQHSRTYAATAVLFVVLFSAYAVLINVISLHKSNADEKLR